MHSHYDVLGLTPEATAEDVKSAYRRLARVVHPDAAGSETGMFNTVSAAYETLSDPKRRAAYDRTLAADRGETDGPAPAAPSHQSRPSAHSAREQGAGEEPHEVRAGRVPRASRVPWSRTAGVAVPAAVAGFLTCQSSWWWELARVMGGATDTRLRYWVESGGVLASAPGSGVDVWPGVDGSSVPVFALIVAVVAVAGAGVAGLLRGVAGPAPGPVGYAFLAAGAFVMGGLSVLFTMPHGLGFLPVFAGVAGLWAVGGVPRMVAHRSSEARSGARSAAVPPRGPSWRRRSHGAAVAHRTQS